MIYRKSKGNVEKRDKMFKPHNTTQAVNITIMFCFSYSEGVFVGLLGSKRRRGEREVGRAGWPPFRNSENFNTTALKRIECIVLDI